ncbi:hypothetical protein AVEN_36987-1 [Araneus ventricosus]|uniref:Helitron helicase-like domain-containing protein n=1 Tax=Araneus ventricosus TaxID=182803 RepID=A0A4Y2VZD5_ARAVE|nr:hypothetical protein AVEN_36987-1 [Araneus ventricosus]
MVGWLRFNGARAVSYMDLYASRFMVRRKANHLMMFRNLFHQYAVDMYAKTKSERLCFNRIRQRQIRTDLYVQLRDAINNDVVKADIGQICIFPSTFTGSRRHMHERTQDFMT